MKVIFLDKDGVLNNGQSYLNPNLTISGIDDFRVGYLKEIVDRTDAKLVLSSSNKVNFRKINDVVVPFSNNNIYASDFIRILNKYNLFLYDIIPNLYDNNGYEVQRQDEIREWLSLNSGVVDNYVILDDETTELMDFVGSNFIILNNLLIGEMLIDMDNSVGLGEEHIDLVVNVLNGKNKSKTRKKTNY